MYGMLCAVRFAASPFGDVRIRRITSNATIHFRGIWWKGGSQASILPFAFVSDDSGNDAIGHDKVRSDIKTLRHFDTRSLISAGSYNRSPLGTANKAEKGLSEVAAGAAINSAGAVGVSQRHVHAAGKQIAQSSAPKRVRTVETTGHAHRIMDEALNPWFATTALPSFGSATDMTSLTFEAAPSLFNQESALRDITVFATFGASNAKAVNKNKIGDGLTRGAAVFPIEDGKPHQVDVRTKPANVPPFGKAFKGGFLDTIVMNPLMKVSSDSTGDGTYKGHKTEVKVLGLFITDVHFERNIGDMPTEADASELTSLGKVRLKE
jgi:hypothetical protein